jgi:hypothetical protein
LLKSHQKVEESGFPTAGRAGDTNLFSLPDAKVCIMKELLFAKGKTQLKNSGDIIVKHGTNLDNPQKSPVAFSV